MTAAPVSTPGSDPAADLDALADPTRAAGMARFFKTGPGQYGAGDVFAGVSVPDVRRVVRSHRDLALADVDALLRDAVHEHRLAAVLLLADRYTRAAKRGDEAECAQVARLYLDRTAWINNWDLVDASAEYVVGPWWRSLGSTGRAQRLKPARSKSLWERRIAVLSTFHDIKLGDSGPASEVCTLLLGDREDLIHKATGWMLREVGKRVSRADLIAFLDEHAAVMPRTMLRYAVEHLDVEQRAHYLATRAVGGGRPGPTGS
ncbi:MAG: DNA alkylation repair protein [Actinomycetales bacterium]